MENTNKWRRKTKDYWGKKFKGIAKQVDAISKGFEKEKVVEFKNEYNQFKKDSWRLTIKDELLKQMEIYSKYQKGVANENNFLYKYYGKFCRSRKTRQRTRLY